ncbi:MULTISPECIES: TetR/AcrR family transcriptional regulator [Pseudonocardia]|uniref:TetR/AcrR family transcriptional regulator n=2 Tax=Pseudonocardiaceae TaxID=2070 RepID=A0ABU9ADR2_PSEA5
MSTPRRAPSGAAVLRPELTEAVVDAVLAELAEVGHGRLSMQRVAARAGVGKSALYRRWPGKDEMVMDVVGRFGVPAEPPPDTGTLVGDLHALVVGMRDWLDHPRLASIVPDLLAESRRSPRLAEAFRERLSGPRRDRSREVLARAVARGEITPEQAGGVEAELVVDLLGSVPFWRVAVHGGPIDDEGAAALARLVARGMTAPHRVGRRPS